MSVEIQMVLFILAALPLVDQGAISFKGTWNDSRALWKVLLPCLSTMTFFFLIKLYFEIM